MLQSFLVIALAASCFLHSAAPARANVYATNIRLNGGTNNLALPPGSSVTISYYLNEPATAGVIIAIKSGSTIVRTISVAASNPGSARGTNTVIWDGKDSVGNNAPSGDYAIGITASATGHGDWTQISEETANYYVWEARGIAVNKNTNSLYYGRVFIGNAQQGANPITNPGDKVGIQKRNADGSPAVEGVFSDGGWDWAHGSLTDLVSPWKIEISDDDRIYISDLKGSGERGLVLSFDQTISSNSLRNVLRSDNWPNGSVMLGGHSISGTGTNTQVWMADRNFGGVGIRRWNVTANGTIATNDLGTTIIQAGPGSDLNLVPFDLALDGSNRIYTVQNTVNVDDPAYRVLRFPTYGGTPELAADWKIGTNDDMMMDAHGIAVDPSGSQVAVAFAQTSPSVRVFDASDGTLVTILAVAWPTDVAWDNAGNLYVTDNNEGYWRTYSPPGTNQATTVALQNVHIQLPPVLSRPVYSSGQFQFTLTGEANVTYIIYASTNLQSWFPVATNTSVFATRTITVTAPPNQRFYYATIGPYSPARPVLTAPSYSAGQFHFTLIGEAGLSYIISSSTNLQAWFPVATNSSGGATRAITINSSFNRSFYRAMVGP